MTLKAENSSMASLFSLQQQCHKEPNRLSVVCCEFEYFNQPNVNI